MEFQDNKRFFLDALVQNGYSKVADLPEQLTAGLPSHLPQKWINRFYKSMKFESLPCSHRLVNRFMIGADPEFVLVDPIRGTHVSMEGLGLHVGPAFGSDLCGRIAELRPAPSRFVLDVVASIMTELRWMALTNTSLREYNWVSKPYIGRDGVGGHVHLGRKRAEYQDKEIKALDRLFQILTTGEVFHKEGVAERRRQTKYGHLGDFRPQRHGYEYRSMPTWLESPWLAYLTLTMAKLTTYNPTLVSGTIANVAPRKFIRNLLAFYKSMDDDALIAYNALETLGFPVQLGTDFRPAWGLVYPEDVTLKAQYIPEIIEGSTEDKEALFNHFQTGRPIQPTIPVAYWKKDLPTDYELALHYHRTIQNKGIGELVSGMATHKSQRVVFESGHDGMWLKFYGDAKLFPTKQQVAEALGIETVVDYRPGSPQVTISGMIRDSNDMMAQLKKLLFKTLPIWKAEEVTADSFEKFNSKPVSDKKPNLKGQVVI